MTDKAPWMVPSLVRTALPYALSATTLLLARVGLDLPAELVSEWVMVALTFTIGTLYYAASRIVEKYLSPLWGAVMLGSGRTPTYTVAKPPAPAAEPVVGACGAAGDCVQDA